MPVAAVVFVPSAGVPVTLPELKTWFPVNVFPVVSDGKMLTMSALGVSQAAPFQTHDLPS
jgi:hypothetical protein